MPKETKESSKTASNMLRHAPLDKQIASSKKKAEGKFSRADPRKLATERRGVDDFQDDDLGGRQGGGPKGGKEFMDAKMSKKIMSQAQEQREEEEEASSAGSERRGGGVVWSGRERWGREVEEARVRLRLHSRAGPESPGLHRQISRVDTC
mmetsp:Transcript_61831/g.123940  ORF Transcript_61831/g.123940 Transcript_61831/m.123940 type:complete len:151 (-) Transcript_61831:828-1280(-)